MTYRNVHDRPEEIRCMTDQELRLALDEALRQSRSAGADELFDEWHLTILGAQAETEWREIMAPIRENLARSKRPLDFEAVAFVLRKPDLITGFHKSATAKKVRDYLPVDKQAAFAQHIVDRQHRDEPERALNWGEMKDRAVGMLLDAKATQRKIAERERLVAEDGLAMLERGAARRSRSILAQGRSKAGAAYSNSIRFRRQRPRGYGRWSRSLLQATQWHGAVMTRMTNDEADAILRRLVDEGHLYVFDYRLTRRNIFIGVAATPGSAN